MKTTISLNKTLKDDPEFPENPYWCPDISYLTNMTETTIVDILLFKDFKNYVTDLPDCPVWDKGDLNRYN